MIAYLDANILLKRVLSEDDSVQICQHLSDLVNGGAHLVTSALSAAEIDRALMRIDAQAPADRMKERAHALSGVITISLDASVLELAGAIPARNLGTLDALLVASAIITRADVVLSRDQQMQRACSELGLATS